MLRQSKRWKITSKFIPDVDAAEVDDIRICIVAFRQFFIGTNKGLGSRCMYISREGQHSTQVAGSAIL